MQTLGYAISAFVPNIIEWLCLDRVLQRKNIPSPVMLLLALFSGLLITLQTEVSYNLIINSLTSIAAIFLFTFCYREPWLYRFFISFSIYVIAVIAEGTSFLIARMFTPIGMVQADTTVYFALIAVGGSIFEALYLFIALQLMKFFKKHRPQMTAFILFLIMVLVYSVIELVVTFTDTAYLVPALILCALLIAAIAGCLYLWNDQLRVQRERMQLAHLREMQQDQVQHYTALYEANRQVAVQRHDLKNILLNVRSYIEVGEMEKLSQYIAKFQEKLQPSKMIDNGMPFIDAVLSAKMAEHPEIPFDLHIALLELEHIEQPQIAFILAGALDNAVEACAHSAKPFIKVQIGQKGRMVSLIVTNAADRPVKAIGDTLPTTKADAAAHGYGIKSMRQTAEQAHGMLTWHWEEQVFTLSMLLQDIAD